MGNEEDEVKEILLGLERLLLENTVRCDAMRISKLLDDSFIEYTSSGKVYVYKQGDVFGESKGKICILDGSVEMKNLSDDTRMLLYKSKKKFQDEKIITNRCSIWKRNGINWKIVFHQGTVASE